MNMISHNLWICLSYETVKFWKGFLWHFVIFEL
jgi:hypothetical protein